MATLKLIADPKLPNWSTFDMCDVQFVDVISDEPVHRHFTNNPDTYVFYFKSGLLSFTAPQIVELLSLKPNEVDYTEIDGHIVWRLWWD